MAHRSVRGMTDPKETLLRYLQVQRDALLWKLDGLGEREVRWPMTPTGTNLLGLIQAGLAHVAEVQAGPAADRPGMHPALEAVARQIEDECRHLYGRYLMSTTTLAEICERIASEVVPHLQAAPIRRALKMDLPRKSARAAAGSRR